MSEDPDDQQRCLSRLLGAKTWNENELWLSVMGPLLRSLPDDKLCISMDQSHLANAYTILMISFKLEGRAVPLVWTVVPGHQTLGAEKQIELLKRLDYVIPGQAPLLLADRAYGSVALINWLNNRKWNYRIRLTSDTLVNADHSKKLQRTPAGLLNPNTFISGSSIFAKAIEVPCSVGVLKDNGFDDAWIVAMPTQI